MVKKLLLLKTLFLVAFGLNAQQDEQSAVDFQQELIRQCSSHESSSLEERDKSFTGHDFYPITDAFRIEAKLALDPLPFTDLITGKETYEVGRYINLEIPIRDTIIIDFNKAYNPYCAYTKNYSCEIPPKENHLGIAVLAGVKKPKK